MSTLASGEGGLSAAIAYCEQLREQADVAISATELTAAALENDEWEGPAVERLRLVLEANAVARGHLDAVLEALAAGNQVKDAYAAAPVAGSKQFVVARSPA